MSWTKFGWEKEETDNYWELVDTDNWTTAAVCLFSF